MKQLEFTYTDSCLLASQEIAQTAYKLVPEIERMHTALSHGYNTPYAALNVPADVQLRADVVKLVQEKQALKPTVLVVIGIGGSNLGTLAVHHALHGSLYNELNPRLRVYFADSVDTDYIDQIYQLAKQELAQNNSVLINVVSKSGTTTETIANFQLFVDLLKQYKQTDYHHYVVATTDKDSKLWQLAQQQNIACMAVPKQVGGRYSVLTAVGLFPLGMLGIDIQQLHAGAQDIVVHGTDINILNNGPALSACVQYIQYTQGKTIHDTFVFARALQSFGAWYRQLMGESIGKEESRSG